MKVVNFYGYKKVELVKKILNSYIEVFEDCRESLIESVYEKLGDTKWYKTEYYSENCQDLNFRF